MGTEKNYSVPGLKMKLFAIGCVLIFYYFHMLVLGQEGCTFPVHRRDGKNSPIALNRHLLFKPPINDTYYLGIDKIMFLMCPGEENYVRETQGELKKVKVKCTGANTLKIVDSKIDFNEVKCKKTVKASLVKTNKTCGDSKGLIYKIGYPTSEKTFLSIIEVCYGDSTATVLFTIHFLDGHEINYAKLSKFQPHYSVEGLSPGVIPKHFNQVYHVEALTNLLNNNLSQAHHYINEDSYLGLSQLSPREDFLFASGQHSTFYYLNVALQWQKIKSGNWGKLEKLIRKNANALRDVVKIYTGTHGVLQLSGLDDIKHDFYLFNNYQLPVPKFMWKIVLTRRKEAIVFVCLNDVYVNEVSNDELLCSNLCDKTGWHLSAWTDAKRGFMYCCSYSEFSQVVKTAPKLEVIGVLKV